MAKNPAHPLARTTTNHCTARDPLQFWRQRAIRCDQFLTATYNARPAHFKMDGGRAYIASGPPYFGKSEFKDMAVIKKAGGRWGGSRKMWKADDESSLKALIETDKWMPDGADGRFVLMAMRVNEDKRRADRQQKEAAGREAAAKKKASQPTAEDVEKQQRKEANIPDDKPDEIKRLWDEYQITPEMLRTVLNWELGPKGAKSDALRTLCGLGFKLITKEEVWCGVRNESRCAANARRMKQEAAARESAKRKDAPTQVTSKVAKVAKVTKAAKVAKAEAAPKKPMNPYSKESIQQLWALEPQEEASNPTSIINTFQPKWVPDAVCLECKQQVTDQFMDCHCLEAVWVRCSACGGKCRTDDTRKANGECLCPLAKQA